ADCLMSYYSGGLPCVLLYKWTASCPIIQANLVFYCLGEIALYCVGRFPCVLYKQSVLHHTGELPLTRQTNTLILLPYSPFGSSVDLSICLSSNCQRCLCDASLTKDLLVVDMDKVVILDVKSHLKCPLILIEMGESSIFGKE
ncbi:hypothetical protein HAX54_015904, partial [Datura stramonium]|nr:hypothetical protein [Datura stramonium]